MKAKKFTDYIKNIASNPWLIWPYLGIMGLLNWVPDSLYLKGCFRAKMGYPLDLKNPQTFNEKIQWLKLYDRKPEYTQMVDKYAVREYIAKTIGEEYLIPLLGVWDAFDEIDFDQLPNQFVLKCNHDSGTVVICKDKKTFNVDAARKKINAGLARNFYYSGREWPYKNVKPKIIAEKFMVDESGTELKDYKIHCFNGIPKYIQLIGNRNFLNHSANEVFLDTEWRVQPFVLTYPQYVLIPPKPQKLYMMLEICEKLAHNTPYIRVDLYYLSYGNIKFGELTFYPASGFDSWEPKEWDKKMGDWIQLPK